MKVEIHEERGFRGQGSCFPIDLLCFCNPCWMWKTCRFKAAPQCRTWAFLLIKVQKIDRKALRQWRELHSANDLRCARTNVQVRHLRWVGCRLKQVSSTGVQMALNCSVDLDRFIKAATLSANQWCSALCDCFGNSLNHTLPWIV